MSTYTLHFGKAEPITLRNTSGKTGNQFLAVRPESEPIVTRFGFNIPLARVGGALPTKGELRKDGELVAKFDLESGKNGNGKPAVTNKQAARFQYDGVEQTLAVRMSQPREGTANVLIRTSRQAASKVVDI